MNPFSRIRKMNLSNSFVFFLILLQFSLICLIYYTFNVNLYLSSKIKSEKIISEVRIPFPADGYTFLNTAADVGIKMFIIDPCIIWRLLSLKEQRKLQNRDSVPAFATACKVGTKTNETIYAFGIFANDVEKLTTTFKEELERKKFKTLKYGDLNIHGGAVSHFMATKGRTYIYHVSVFFERGNFLMVYELNSPLFSTEYEDIKFGASDAAFDSFDLVFHSVNGHKVLFPSDHQYFMFQIPHSTFLECRHDLAEKFKEKYPQDGQAAERLLKTLDVMKGIMKTTLLPIWMDGGSLLGWARHCGEIPYERDADFASYGYLHRKKYDLTNELIKSVKKPWYFIETFGFPWSSYEMRLYNVDLGWQVDLFFTTDDEEYSDQIYTGYHTFPGVYFIKLYFEKSIFEYLCSAEVFSTKVLIPCKWEKLLLAEYGEGWVTPQYHHGLNVGKHGHREYWTEKEAFYTYQCLGRYQFNARPFNYSDYKYDSVVRRTETSFSQGFQDVINEYKAVCTRLRWNRVD